MFESRGFHLEDLVTSDLLHRVPLSLVRAAVLAARTESLDDEQVASDCNPSRPGIENRTGRGRRGFAHWEPQGRTGSKLSFGVMISKREGCLALRGVALCCFNNRMNDKYSF